VIIYLNKLAMNTSKFRVESTRYASYQNPAYLPVIKSDRLLLLLSFSMQSYLPGTNTYDRYGTTVTATESSVVSRLGYSLPLGERFALGTEVFFSNQGAILEDPSIPSGDSDLWVSPLFVGGILSSGLRFGENFSAGLSVGVYEHIEPGEDLPSETRISAEAGVLAKNSTSSFIFDTRVMYTSEEYPVPDYPTYDWTEEKFIFYLMPITWENTFTWSPSQKLFVVVKQINYIFLESDNFTVDLIPAVEYWFSERLSARTGIDGKYLRHGDRNDWALGAIAGLSIKLRRFFFDLNIELRDKPYYLAPEERFSELLASLTLGSDGLFVKR
jgi:hypothetical protein